MAENVSADPVDRFFDRRIRHAMRILENEQILLPSTEEVATRVGLSVFHFVRRFRDEVGLSPQDYGRSVLLSCAASRIRYSSDPIAVVARDFGYAKQATFHKAFMRLQGEAPARWRRKAQAEIVPVSSEGVHLQRLPAQRCLARRYFGPRSLTAAQWADFLTRLPPRHRGRPRIGFNYDDPRVTPPGLVRHDCAVAVEGWVRPTARMTEAGFELLEIPAGIWAMSDAEPRRVGDAYPAVFDGWFQRQQAFALEGDPHLERHGVMSGGEPSVSVCVRVRPVVEEGQWNMAVLDPDAAEPEVTESAQALP